MKKFSLVLFAAIGIAGCSHIDFWSEPEPVKTALYVGKGALGVGEYGWLQIATFAKGLDATLVDAAAIRTGALDRVSLLIMPGGRSWTISRELGADGRAKVEAFVRSGGRYLGTCAGAFLASESSESHPKMMGLVPYTSRGGAGHADMMIRFNDRATELAGIKAGSHRIAYAGGPIFTPGTNAVADAEYEVLATYDSNINTWTNKPLETMAGKAAVIAGRCGKGRIFISTVHPEVDLNDRYVIEGAFKYLTGRTVTWDFPQRKRGDLAVGIDMEKGFRSVENARAVQEVLLGKIPGVDPVAVNETILNEGTIRHLDGIVKPTVAGMGEIARLRALPPEAFGTLVDKPWDTKRVKVAVYADKGGVNFSIADRLALSPAFEVKSLSGADIANGKLKGFDMLLQPGGWSPSQYEALGTNGTAAIDAFIRNGGSYYGLCAGAFLVSQTREGGSKRMDLVPWKDIGEEVYRGWAPEKITVTPDGAANLGIAVTNMYVTYWGGPIFEPGTPVAGADIRPWGVYHGYNLNTCNSSNVLPMAGHAAFLGGTLGKGRVFISGPHPEKDERSYKIVSGAIKYLTGKELAPVRNDRKRGALSVAMTDTRTVEFLDTYLNALLRDRRFDIRFKFAESDMKHLDAIVIGSPKSDSFTPELKGFAANGGTVIAVADNDKSRAAVSNVTWATVIPSARLIPAALGAIAPDPLKGAEEIATETSPDGRNEIRIFARPFCYEVRRDGKIVVERTPVDLEVDGKGLAAAYAGPLTNVGKRVRSGHVATPVYKKSSVAFDANEAFLDCGAWGLRLVARNDGVAYRFETKSAGEQTVTHERGGVTLAPDALCHVPFTTGYGKEQRHPETLVATNLPVFNAKHPKFAYLPFLFRTKGVVAAVVESDVCDYPVLNCARTSPEGTAGPVLMESVFARWPTKAINNAGLDRAEKEVRQRHWLVRGRADRLVKTAGTRTFPWRGILLADDYPELFESDLVYALARPQEKGVDFSWVKPGKVAWDWWNAFDNIGDPIEKGATNGCTTATYKRFIDFAAKNGVEYVIMDEGWSKKLNIWEFAPDVDVPELIRYGAAKNVGIILWMAWAQIEGQEEKVAAHFARIGAKGFKVDFMDRGDAQVERFLWKFADACARHKLLVDWHGAHRPTGQHRAYPNVVNYEGVHGLEAMKFGVNGEDFMDNDVKTAFVRMTAGPLDYTPGAMRNFPKGDTRAEDYTTPGSFGTRCHQMALMALYEAPLQMLCDSPTHYEENQECFDFMAKTPTVWAKTVGLGGSPDTFAAIARESRDGAWWVSAISNWEPRDFAFRTDFLGKGVWEAEIFRDAPDAEKNPTHYVHEKKTVRSGEKMSVRMAPGGGFAMRFVRVKQPVKVAIYTDAGARNTGVYRHIQINELCDEIEILPVDAAMIRGGALGEADLLVMPGGASTVILGNLEEEGREAIRAYIRNGGKYFGTCAGACVIMQDKNPKIHRLGIIPYRSIGSRGHADMKMRFTKEGQDILSVTQRTHRVRYSEGPVLVDGKPVAGADFKPILRYDSHVDTNSTKPRETMANKIAGVAGTYGKGRVVAYAVHPEYDYDDHFMIEAAYRHLTGRDLTWKIPQRREGQLAVGFLTENGWSVEAADLVRTLVRGEKFDIEPVNREAIRNGALRHLDVLVAPLGNEFAKLKGRYFTECKSPLEHFQNRGGTIVAYGPAANVFRLLGGEVIDTGSAANVPAVLKSIVLRGPAAMKPIVVPPYAGKKIRTAVYTDKGGANYNVLETFALSPEFDVKVLGAKDVANGALRDFDLLLQPGGGCNAQYQALGKQGADEIERFVRAGGAYYGICAGAFLATQTCSPEKPRIGLVPFKDQNIGFYRGWGEVPMKITEEGFKVFGNSVTNRDIVYWGGPVLLPGDPVADADVKVLGTYNCHHFCSCSPTNLPPWQGCAAFLGGRVGKGKVFISGPHPEKQVTTYDMVRAGIRFLTGVTPTQVSRDRRRGQRRVMFKTDKRPEVAAYYATNVLFRADWDVTASAEFGDLSHFDTILIPSPHKKDFGPKLEAFAKNGGSVLVLIDTPEKAAAVKGVGYVRKLFADVLSNQMMEYTPGPIIANFELVAIPGRNYRMQRTEVTQRQWMAVMGSNPSDFRGPDRPVDNVSWDDCQEFIRRVSMMDGRTYRLPTAEEWEHACRAGSTEEWGKRANGECGPLDAMGWYGENNLGEQGAHAVALKEPNAWGLFDMHGNVWEWCQDQRPADDTDRANRGGGWSNDAWFCSASHLDYNPPDHRSSNLGFRLATTQD